ncbi:hypothetical protein EIP91_008174 [Steccherinum ochraceum]|uniref:Uncharacterized protein n=1 Tax=Steccherinum ochraceum TaxID=92696 RepID=A0A4R0RBE9_9APHY|nr:hypothetical protein EIP91_008174 [Steccherinum ochraceum]
MPMSTATYDYVAGPDDLLSLGLCETKAKQKGVPRRVYGYPYNLAWLEGKARRMESDPAFRWSQDAAIDAELRAMNIQKKALYIVIRIQNDMSQWKPQNINEQVQRRIENTYIQFKHSPSLKSGHPTSACCLYFVSNKKQVNVDKVAHCDEKLTGGIRLLQKSSRRALSSTAINVIAPLEAANELKNVAGPNELLQFGVHATASSPLRVYGYAVSYDWLEAKAQEWESNPSFRWTKKPERDENIRRMRREDRDRSRLVITRLKNNVAGKLNDKTFEDVEVNTEHWQSPTSGKVGRVYCLYFVTNSSAAGVEMGNNDGGEKLSKRIEALQQELGTKERPRWFQV